MTEKEKCGKEIKCYDYLKRPCLREKGHSGGCNPFSDTAYDTEIKKEKDE